jgi:hypothetical protein
VSGAVFQIVWTPGTDDLLGVCHCGAEHVGQDPAEVWSWLLAHPDGHGHARAGLRIPAGAGATGTVEAVGAAP